MEYRDKILEMLKKKNTLTFEEISDHVELEHEDFFKIIMAMQNDKLVIVNETKEIVYLKR